MKSLAKLRPAPCLLIAYWAKVALGHIEQPDDENKKQPRVRQGQQKQQVRTNNNRRTLTDVAQN